nr:replication-associated recombination protein A [Saprospiraceae bacterium]
KAVRDILAHARELITTHRPAPILFLDEIHRFSKSQQDSLLGGVEKGIISLIGATTENPSFEINNALLSRCRVYKFQEMGVDELSILLDKAIRDDEILSQYDIDLKDKTELFRYSGGDVRRLLNALESAVESVASENSKKISITDELVAQVIHLDVAQYDKDGENHYDMASAFIKSIRGSDPDAALFWMHRMLAGGEDIKFICRRMIISASEDIGLANPNAMLLADSCFRSAVNIGLPEAEIPMSQTAIYLACSPKSNSAYVARNKAGELARQFPNVKVPLHLRNATSKLTRELGYGKGYLYPHDYKDNFVIQDYLPVEIKNVSLYTPADNAHEEKFKHRLDKQKE